MSSIFVVAAGYDTQAEAEFDINEQAEPGWLIVSIEEVSPRVFRAVVAKAPAAMRARAKSLFCIYQAEPELKEKRRLIYLMLETLS